MAVMKTANVNVRIQENIKEQAEQILETLGISRASAIDMFYRQIILKQGIPFPLTVSKTIPIREEMDEDNYDDTDEEYDEDTNEELKDLVVIDEDELELEQ